MFPTRRFRRCHPGADGGAGEPRATLDPEAIERLRQLDPDGSRGFIVQVLRTYEASLRRHLAALDEAALEHKLTAAQVVEVGRVAHTLKSSSASVGASSFAALCAGVEQQAKSGDFAVLGTPLQALREEGARTLEVVRAMLPA
jgi:HPt (histidine-containing phosphotransfer) domain-containing protein